LKSYPVLELVAFAKGKADKPARKTLGMAGSAKAVQFTNLHSQNGEPVMVDEITLPEALFATMSETTLRQRPSTLYNLYQLEFGLNVIRIEERLRAAHATPRHAALLGVDAGAPLLRIERTAFSYNDHAVEWRVSYVNTQRYEYFPMVAQ
jgi:GntR family transcriptional regulator